MDKNKIDVWLVMPIFAGAVLFGALYYLLQDQESRTIRYDCSIAEISPDFPVEVKKACRERKKTV